MVPTNRVNFSTAEMPVARSFVRRPAVLPFFEMWPELSADEAPLSLLVFMVRARTMAAVCARVRVTREDARACVCVRVCVCVCVCVRPSPRAVPNTK